MFFIAVDSTDLKTRETGLTTFTVYRSRNGGAATAYTTPTVSELSAANMPGVYALTLDEDTTLAAGHDTEEYCVHITQASMAPVTRVFDIHRVKFTEGQSATMANSAVDADLERIAGAVVSVATAQLGVNVVNVGGTVQTAGDIIADTNDIQARIPAALVGGRMASIAEVVGDKIGYALTSADHTLVADALLKRDMSAVTGEAARSPLNAFRFLRNKWSLAASTLTVTKEDDVTAAWTAAVSTDAAAVPVIGSDPA